MSESIYCQCPKCKNEVLEFNFCGRNGYVSFCKICQGLLYYCSVFGNIDFFKNSGETFEKHYDQFITEEEANNL